MKKRIWFAMIALTLAALAIAPSVAWFGRLAEFTVNPTGLTGKTAAAYFESGNGTKENPYVIATPTHFYNFAWLQYIGYFNMGEGANNGQNQSYFVLKNDIDMDGLTIPPIGTLEYPFIGNFDGGEHVVSHVNTANAKEALKLRPNDALFGEDDNLIFSKVEGENVEIAVMGFFGVVGNYDNDANHTKSDVDETIITVKDLAIANYNLASSTTTSTVGFVAGYVDAPVTGVMVANCTLSTPENATPAIQQISNPGTTATSGNTAISEHTLIGYCTADYENVLNVTEYQVKDPTVDNTQTDINDVITTGPGTDTNWGGSIAMNALHTDLRNSLAAAASRQTEDVLYRLSTITTIDENGNSTDTQVALTDKFIKSAQNNSTFSAVFSPYTLIEFTNGTLYTDITERYLSLTGGYMNATWTVEDLGEDLTGYPYHVGNSYMNLNAAGNGLEVGTAATASVWIFDDGYLYTIRDAVTYYVYPVMDSIDVDTTKRTNVTMWVRSDSGELSASFTIGMTFKTQLRLYNNDWRSGTAGTIASRGTAQTIENVRESPHVEIYKYDTVRNQATNEYYNTGVTYIPLQMNYDASGNCLYTPLTNNTGYITSGLYDALNTGGLSEHREDGDIRVSQYFTGNITNHNTVKTIRQNANGTASFVEIPTSNYASNNNYTNLNLQQYANAVTTYNELLANTSNNNALYGLHFMSGLISQDSLVTVPSATINGVNYTNYQLPGDSIDFHVKATGYITFFAGTYFPDNNCFFSLHHIERDANQNITSIKEIKSIYQRGTVYVYAYEDGTCAIYNASTKAYEPATLANTDTLVFNMAWLKDPDNRSIVTEGWTGSSGSYGDEGEDLRGAGYYFEIPANPGEYALGSVSNDASGETKIGAYLLYLDIGASLQGGEVAVYENIDRVVIDETFVEEQYSYTYAEGVGVLASAADGTTSYAELGDQALSITLEEGYGTNLSLLRTGDTLTLSATTASSAILNAATGLDVTAGTNVTLTDNASTPVSRTVTRRVTYIDTNRTTNEAYTTVVTLTYIDNDLSRTFDENDTVITHTVAVEGDTSVDSGIELNNATGGTTFKLAHCRDREEISWNTVDLGNATTVLAYRYPGDGEAVTNTPVFTLSDEGTTGTYKVTVDATAATTVTIITNEVGNVATSAPLVPNGNVTIVSSGS